MTSLTVLPIPAPTQLLLRVSFDVDQESAQLDYKLLPVGPLPPDPDPQHGVSAGSIYFAPGEELGLQVIGSGDVKKDYVSFQIIDCSFITLPQVTQRGANLKTQYAAPSPFLQARGAVYSLPLDFRASCTTDEQDHQRIVTMDWKQTLNVGYTPGFWELSFVLTVRIMRGTGAVSEVRVLSFDPESEVGTSGTMKSDRP